MTTKLFDGETGERLPDFAPCPFCGARAGAYGNEFGRVYVMCGVCKAAGPLAWPEEEAAKAWNRRDPTALAAEK